MILKLKKPLFLLLGAALCYCCTNGKGKEEQIAVLEAYPSEESKLNDSLVAALGTHIEDAIFHGESKEFTKKVDIERFKDRAVFLQKTSPKIREFQNDFAGGLDKGFIQLADQIIAITENGGTYEFISYSYNAETSSYHILFRMFSEELGINYHDYDLISFDGKFFVEDIYVYLNGEALSSTMNNLFLASLPGNLLEKFLSVANKSDMPNLVQAMKEKKQGNLQAALNHLNKVRGPLKKVKIYHLLKTQITSALDEDEYKRAMLDFKSTFPDDPATNMVFIDYYILNGNYEDALKSINILKRTTQDDFLHYLIGNIHFESSAYEQALPSYEIVTKMYPDFDSVKFSLMAVYANTNAPEKCISILNQLLESEVYLANDLIEYIEEVDENEDNIFSDFVTSPDYKIWKNKNQRL